MLLLCRSDQLKQLVRDSLQDMQQPEQKAASNCDPSKYHNWVHVN
jgi:hypothetical protein